MQEHIFTYTSNEAVICLAVADAGTPAIPSSLLQVEVLDPLECKLLVVVGQLQVRITVLIPR